MRGGRTWTWAAWVAIALAALAAWLLAGAPPVAGGDDGKAAQPPAPPARYGDVPEEMAPYRGKGEPYHRFFTERPAYRGPGREEPPPEGLRSVRIGMLAPLYGSPEAPIGTSARDGALLAIEEANARGGWRGLPYELVARNDLPLWGSSSSEVARLACDDGVWAVLGSVDGASTHVAIRVALKIEIPVVATACTDPTLTETMIPWLLRVCPDDRQECYLLARQVFQERGLRRVAILRGNERYGRAGVAEFLDSARRLGFPVVADLRYPAGGTGIEGAVAKIREARADALVTWGQAGDMGRLVKRLRELGVDLPVFGPDRMLLPEFLREAGRAAEGVVAAVPFDPDREDPPWRGFQARFRKRFGRDPDHFAAYSYDGARILLEAIEGAGLNRARIRDALLALDRWEGVTGTMRFDPTGNQLGRVLPATVKDGKFVFSSY